MNFGSAQVLQFVGLKASSTSPSHILYHAPLSEIHRAARTDSTNVMVVAFVGRTKHSKSLLANHVIDRSAFLVRLHAFKFHFLHLNMALNLNLELIGYLKRRILCCLFELTFLSSCRLERL